MFFFFPFRHFFLFTWGLMMGGWACFDLWGGIDANASFREWVMGKLVGRNGGPQSPGRHGRCVRDRFRMTA